MAREYSFRVSILLRSNTITVFMCVEFYTFGFPPWLIPESEPRICAIFVYSELQPIVNRVGFTFHFERVTKCSNKQNEWSYNERLRNEKKKNRKTCRERRENVVKEIIRCLHIYVNHARTHWKTFTNADEVRFS